MKNSLLGKSKPKRRSKSHVTKKRISSGFVRRGGRGSRKKGSRVWQKVTLLPRRVFQFSSLKLLLLFLPVLLVGFAIYWIWDTRYFSIKQIEVAGNDIIPAGQVISVVDSDQQNIFTFSPEEYEDDILAQFDYAEEVYIEKVLPNKLVVRIKEREPFVVWRTVNGAYLLDESGYVIEAYHDENVSLDTISIALTIDRDADVPDDSISLEAFEDLGFEEETDGEDEDQEDDEYVLDPELEAAIDEELNKRMTAVDISSIDFEQYFHMPENPVLTL